MARKRGLGRGLDALLEKTQPSVSTDAPLAELHPNEQQPRQRFDDEQLGELAQSIREQGLIQPIVVMPRSSGGYTIVAGERRWRAAKRAGLERVPIVELAVRDDRHLLEIALVENLQRTDLDPIEEAEAYKVLLDRFGLSQEKVAAKVGKARATVANTLRLLRFSEPIQAFLKEGRLTPGQLRPLLALEDELLREKLAKRIAEQGWSARRVEAEVKRQLGARGKNSKAPKKRQVDVHTADAEEQLTRKLQTKVEIHRSKQGDRGTMRISFHSEEELIRLFEVIAGR